MPYLLSTSNEAFFDRKVVGGCIELSIDFYFFLYEFVCSVVKPSITSTTLLVGYPLDGVQYNQSYIIRDTLRLVDKFASTAVNGDSGSSVARIEQN